MCGVGVCCIPATCSTDGRGERPKCLENAFGARFPASHKMRLVVGGCSGMHRHKRTRLLGVGICMVLDGGPRVPASPRTAGALLNCIDDKVSRKCQSFRQGEFYTFTRYVLLEVGNQHPLERTWVGDSSVCHVSAQPVYSCCVPSH